MTVGLFSCLWRIIRSVFFGIFFVGRLDRSVFTRDLEHFDKGYESYIATLLVDNAHNNPCMRVFAHLLWTNILSVRHVRLSHELASDSTHLVTSNQGHRYYTTGAGVHQTEENQQSLLNSVNQWTFCGSSSFRASKQMFNRWHVIYTLINNPELCKFRKHNLSDLNRNF